MFWVAHASLGIFLRRGQLEREIDAEHLSFFILATKIVNEHRQRPHPAHFYQIDQSLDGLTNEVNPNRDIFVLANPEIAPPPQEVQDLVEDIRAPQKVNNSVDHIEAASL